MKSHNQESAVLTIRNSRRSLEIKFFDYCYDDPKLLPIMNTLSIKLACIYLRNSWLELARKTEEGQKSKGIVYDFNN